MIDQLLHPSILGTLKAEYETHAPREAVGFILKDMTVQPMVNEATNTMEFTISAAQMRSTFPDLNLLDTLYHTHVHSSAQPSPGDVRNMWEYYKYLPDLRHMIIAKDHTQIWEVRSTGPCILGHFQI